MLPTEATLKQQTADTDWTATTFVADDSRTRRPSIVKIADGVYCAHDYALANVFFVITADSIVVIDTTESIPAARAVLQALRQISPLPVSHLIYTHHHGDHILAANVFCSPTTSIIAHQLLPQEVARRHLLLAHGQRVNANHHAQVPTPPSIEAASGSEAQKEAETGYLPPTVTFDEKHCFEQGGVRVELFHMPGETSDQIVVWLPQSRTLFPADLFYPCFPMLSSPMRPDRPVAAWAKSIGRLRDLQPEHLAPSAGRPIKGAARIDQMLARYEDAIRYVHDETVKCINAGRTVGQAMRWVRLPRTLARLPYLHEKYGKVNWAVRGLFRQYTGWYSFNPTDLNPRPALECHRTLLEVCGGPDPLMRRAQKALDNKNFQLALELTEIAQGAETDQSAATQLRIAALESLAAASTNNVERNAYRNAARDARAAQSIGTNE